jgi:iron complex outermembrane receptor protein
MKETALSRSIRLLFSGGVAVGVGLLMHSALAQEANAPMQRVEITGSSIKRIAQEGALPVTTLTREDINRTGATSVTDLIQMLPSMQGFVPAASSVNGGGGGITTASLHSLPSKYTLVLLDGKRLAPQQLGNSQGGGFAVNLESIPLDAIERVEILSDGASAIYGSDAIGGVVNFILKKNKTDGDVSLTYNRPQHPGARSWNFAVSKGFGDLDKDGFNVLLTYSHDNQDKLQASDRPFSARGAYFPFTFNGTRYLFNQSTSNTEPANITFNAAPRGDAVDANGVPVNLKQYSINPYYRLNGNCGTPLASVILDPTGTGALSAVGESCRFNYAATVQDIPSYKRDSGLAKGTLKLNDDTTLWGTLALSSFTMRAQFAPGAQPMGLNDTTRLPVLYNRYVAPFLNANNLDIYAPGSSLATLGYRLVANGGRTDDYKTDTTHVVAGIDGSVKGWDYRASFTWSRSTLTDTAAGGYTDFDQFANTLASGAYDPVMGTGASAVAPYVLGTQFSKSISDLRSLQLNAQHDMFKLPGGTSILALGAEYSTFHYRTSYADLILSQSGFSTQPASADYPIGGTYGQVPFDADRSNWGVYGEWLFPVMKGLDVTASARYDSYSKVHSRYVFSEIPDPNSGLQNQLPDADLGNTFSATTGKLSLRYTPTDTLLLRASYGTGFKAPNISDIAGALVFGGNTGGSYACPFPGSAGCQPGNAQYDFLTGPNGQSGDAGLKPEKSKQWTLGFRVDPIKGLSIGMDLWNVKINDQILSQGIAEQVGFAHPQQYSSLFVNPYPDPAGFTTIAFKQIPFNGGEAEYRGLDWDISYKNRTPYGNLGVSWIGTYMLKQRYNFGPGEPFNSDLGVFGPDQQVVFRVVTHLAVSLQTGPFTNTLTAHYKSGYWDQAHTADEAAIFPVNPDGSLGLPVAFSGHRVPSYTTFDWQTKYAINKAVTATFGIKNLFDRDPPFTLQSGGGGDQIGYDGRYADPIGRQFYATLNYKF